MDEIQPTEESCGASHPLIDGGRPCIKFPGHVRYIGQSTHLTASGIWWEDED